ncbi:phenylalanine--tRNA ligase subunit beta [Trichlorobacter ammonificans]|uniref:Phenylalanine--tRNA ligase beta subunit n=1 Tax=Trichlorobacter ammonificans TaxID=2916410 RepID=A0ABN8HIW2_9BACT|nr:phenylalanine--tRNA ligase subunit beta [Trichlorobacter ammonificans]CAH2031523.1 Phenylalanine--tRNA ligase beta subunit [Trichlorobacter ammonificans]
MKVTYNWLKEFVDFDLAPVELADLLTMLGLEVEGMEHLGGGLDEVVVARVIEKAQHPNADKLSLCKIDAGDGELLSVVCGAQNFSQGATVALARIGAVLPGEFKIKRSKIRGEESFGMLCSEKELGLAEESDGIMLLSDELSLGQPVFEALKLKDTVFEIGLTPNRADCLSVIGIAREIAAKLGRKVKYPVVTPPEDGEPVHSKIKVTIQDSTGCPRYAARYLTGCTIGPSPAWLVNRLQAVGVRSINNAVDVTNLVMLEMGQPLHAFDHARVGGGQIVVRRAEEGEVFVTLDNQERKLTADDLVICDRDKPVALAGVMGGLNSEISNSTTDILLESAFFSPPVIRKTAKRLGLHTESSHRFERGVDFEGVPRALDRAAVLIAHLTGGRMANGQVDACPAPRKPVTITFRPERANELLGLNLSSDRMADLFRSLEFNVIPTANGSFQVCVPSFRVDIEREIDLIEEICRLNGFDQVPATLPVAQVVSERPSPHQTLQRQVRDCLVAAGMNEIVTFSFIGPEAADRLLLPADDPRRNSLALCNPLAQEQSVMRTTLLPGLLETAARNLNFRNLDLRLFELRRIYLPEAGAEMPREPLCCAGLLSGARDEARWCHDAQAVDFFDAKGIVESILGLARINGVRWSAEQPEPFHHPGKSARFCVGDVQLGTVGEIHPVTLQHYGIDYPVYGFEINFEALVRLAGGQRAILPPSRYPDSVRDLALLMERERPVADLLDCVQALRIKELEEVGIFDLYQGERIPAESKSVALRLRYRSSERTLTDDEVQKLHQKVIDAATRNLGATIR